MQLEFGRSDKAENKALFDALLQEREAIEGAFGSALEWKRLDHKISSRVEFAKQFDSCDATQWDEIIEWMIDNLRRLHASFDASLKAAASQLL